MSDDIATVPDDVLYKAIEDVTGLQFNGLDEAESQAIKIVMAKIIDNEFTADAFAQRIALYSRPAAVTPLAVTEKYSNVRLRTTPPVAIADDPMLDEAPSEASPADAQPHAALWWPSAAIDSSYIFVSPKILGFSPGAELTEWKNDVGSRWYLFLQTAEKQMKTMASPRPQASGGQPDFTSHIFHPGKNYSVLDVQAPELRSTTHFLFDPDNLYVVVASPHGTNSKFSVSVDDTHRLATNLVDAFKGRVDYAKLALHSMTKAFNS